MATINIQRFIDIQDEYNNYETALKEIKDGRKLSHWIWYIFPQIKGLGHSMMSKTYSIDSLLEAKAYWENDILHARLKEITEALLSHADDSAENIFGGLDAMKVKSCMTLFDVVSPHDIFEKVLDTFYEGERCRRTLSKLTGPDSRKISIYDRFKGVLYGQAIGDALGLGTEFMTDEDMAWKYPNGLQHYNQIFQDRHRKRWKIGDWTDDTDMALCIAKAVIEDKGVDFKNIARHFKAWANGTPMGIGENTYKVLSIGDYLEKPFDVSKKVWEMSHCQSAANGGLMRTSVVGLFPKATKLCAENICKLTHYDPRCVGTCVIISQIINALVYGNPVPNYTKIINMALDYDERIADCIKMLRSTNDIKDLMDDDCMGYTLLTFSVALWTFWNAKSFVEGLLTVVNAGGDADTNAAVACAILGAKFGYNSIPSEYTEGLLYKEDLNRIVEELASICIKE
jgi:ADP-ribosylglycohydrolase/uncharacterized protein (DUF1810 family)